MASLRVTRRAGDTIDLFSDVGTVRGTLTTGHAASSHGLPVFVPDDGTALGPAEVDGVIEAEDAAVWTPEYLEHRRGQCWDNGPAAKRYEGPVVRLEARELWAAARAAGYDVWPLPREE